MNKNLRNVLLYLGIPIILILAILSVSLIGQAKADTSYYDIITQVQKGEISEYTLNLYNGDLSYVTRDDGKKHTYTVASPSIFYEDVNEAVMEYNAQHPDSPIKMDYKRGESMAWLSQIMPTLLLIVIMVILGFWFMKKMGSTMGADKSLQFGKAKPKKETNRKTTFADVAGADEEKEEMVEIVDFLKDHQKFDELGARIPKGVLLVGPPGTGKTLLARAVAGEAGVPFFSISGSDFVEMFVGVGASRVRDLFDEAKKNAPSIIFIDEIDAVGRQRGAGLGGGHDEREQTLNQLLVEMDGFGANEGVIVMAATNRPDILDKALLRPGRFDRQITVNYPDVKGREEILKVHSRGKPLGPDVNLKTIAASTAGFTGADLENLLNEAALLAVRRGKKAITQPEIEEATIKVVMGTEKKSHVIKDKDKMITSYHEAGHAIVSYFLPTQDPVHQISIIPRGMAAGYTMYIPTEEKGHISRITMLEQICSLLGGRAAEQLTQDDICTGASNDIQRATELARKMITKYGMSEKLGLITFGTDNDAVFLGRDFSSTPNYSEKIAAQIDEEINSIVMTQYDKALAILKENMTKLHEVAKVLFTEEKIDGEQFRAIMEEKPEAIEE
ncbi:MAG: ATP-dependent zinc metalloprotease FtsH [Acutalibacteraceae bacterium]|nr:ATP-dependent zinc metalloprotease FtsH [Acutalibacteraceae bacterium]